MNLYKLLNIKKGDYDFDNIYKNINVPNKDQTLAWKILRDKFYKSIYDKYNDLDLVYNAGFFNDKLSLDEIDFYKLNLLTTPINKIKIDKNTKNPVVILSTGGFCPIHDGHIEMMNSAKKILESNGYDVIGGYFSPSHDSYVLTKENISIDFSKRLYDAQIKISGSDWIMIDPFESKYIKTYVNFTDIILRLEKYLRKYVRKDIKVAYVFGADNANFMYCFEQHGIGVCINRNGSADLFNNVKKNISNKNTFYIDINNNADKSSRYIRKNTDFKNNNTGTYIIRNEELLPFDYLINNNQDIVLKAQQNALKQLEDLIKNTININTKTIKVSDQLNIAYNKLNNKNTISLDKYFNGTYNVDVSRQFEMSDLQQTFTKLRIKNYDIPNGEYIIVDDDSVSGQTIKKVKEVFNNIQIKEYYFLASQFNLDIFDVVDFRDFIIGAKNGGLVVKFNDVVLRAPYINPFVSLYTRANIPLNKELEFSKSVLDINIEFYKSTNENIKLFETNDDTILLFALMGYKKEDKLINILIDLKNNLNT